MSNFPLISIVIPVYNNEKLLEISLKSCVNQSYKNLEIIVISDGTDDTLIIHKIIKSFNDDRIKYIENIKNKGVSSVLNQAIELSKGQYLNWLSHDDYFDINKIKLQYQHLVNKKAQISYCNFIQVKDKKKLYIKSINLNNYSNQFLKLLKSDNIHGCSLLIEKSIFKNNNFRFNTHLKHVQDYDLWLKIIKQYRFIHLDKFLLYSYDHPNQSSKKLKKEARIEKLNFYLELLAEEYRKKNNFYVIFTLSLSLASRNYLEIKKLRAIFTMKMYKFMIIIGWSIGFIIYYSKSIIKIIK